MEHQKCKTCKSSEFINENCETVCTNCGDVQDDDDFEDEGKLVMLPDNEAVEENFRIKKFETKQRLTSRIRGETNDADSRRQISREKLLDEMKRCYVKQLIKHSRAVDETMDLIKSTLEAYEGRLLSTKKLGLVGACIYYLSAKHQLGISLGDICKVLNIKMKVISVCLKQVRQLSPKFEYERPNLKDLVSRYINELASKHYDFDNTIEQTKGNSANSSSNQQLKPLIDNKDRLVLQNRVMLLVDLFEAMHPYNQPTPQCLITAVIYHAWKSLDTFKLIAVNLSSGIHNLSNSNQSKTATSEEQKLSIDESFVEEQQQVHRKAIKVKHSISFEKFCQICNLKYSSNGYKIVSKLQTSLLSLGRFLGDVNKINLPWFLKDIIENSPHLIQEHLRTDTPIIKPPGSNTS